MDPTIYIQEENIIVRSMLKSDIQALKDGFTAQGWGKDIETLEGYFEAQQKNNGTYVFVAECEGKPVGYTVLYPQAMDGPYGNKGIPYISDFVVFIPYQKRGIGGKIMDAAEAKAFETCNSVCLGVGLHYGYGAAQRMYAKRNYIPDGSGVWYMGKQHEQYAPCANDDDLILYMAKEKI